MFLFHPNRLYKFLLIAVLTVTSVWGCLQSSTYAANSNNNEHQTAQDFVSANGQLKVIGTQLCNQLNQPIQLKGMSSHGIAWYPQFVNQNSMEYLRDNWHASVIRIAMYTKEGGGYITNPAVNKAKVEQAIDDAIKAGIYVIVDWHILSDYDPNMYIGQSRSFFGEISTKYKNVPNVIYEICNEPNGYAAWNTSIKPYAEEIIPVIRANSPEAIVIVGTGKWCQEVLDAAKNPLKYNNIMYSCHFYVGTHPAELRNEMAAAMDKGIAIFVSEWGTTDASGSSGPYPGATKRWLNFLNSKQISWCNWSLCDKNETSAALRPGADPNGGWTDNNLSASGKLVKAAMLAGSTQK